MKRFLKNYSFILMIYGVIALLATLLVFWKGKADIHLLVNRNNHFLADIFFKYITHLGDGLFAAILVVVLLFIKFRHSLTQAIAAVLAGLSAQLMKRLLFPGVSRPAGFFENEYELYFVEGVKILKSFSFPSGHAATAFALFFCLIFLTKKRWLQIIYLTLAIIVGYSRMYLSLHFLPDIIAGSLLGLLSALIATLIINTWDKSWMERRLRI